VSLAKEWRAPPDCGGGRAYPVLNAGVIVFDFIFPKTPKPDPAGWFRWLVSRKAAGRVVFGAVRSEILSRVET
jgi:hypothetical protein